MPQQKQRKKLILTEDNNLFTYCFLPIQRLQPNFKTDDKINFMYTNHKGGNAKLRIFSFIKPNFMYHIYQTIKQRNTSRTTKTTTSRWVSPLTQSLLQLL